MIYDAFKIAKHLNISKVTAYAKMKLPEIKPFIIMHNGKTCVDEKGLDAIKQSLKYNQNCRSRIRSGSYSSDSIKRRYD